MARRNPSTPWQNITMNFSACQPCVGFTGFGVSGGVGLPGGLLAYPRLFFVQSKPETELVAGFDWLQHKQPLSFRVGLLIRRVPRYSTAPNLPQHIVTLKSMHSKPKLSNFLRSAASLSGLV